MLHSRHTNCPECQLLSKQGRLPHLREASAAWRARRQAEREAERLLNPPLPPNSQPRECLCTVCRKPYVVVARYSKYCDNCSRTAYRHLSRLKQRRAARARGVEQIGSLRECRRCGAEFPMRGALHIYCDTCKPEVERERVLAYRPQAYRHTVNYIRRRLKTDEVFALNMRMSAAIRKSVTRGTKRRQHWEALVGYTTGQLMRHLERQFLKGMSWANRSEWHIDHIVPLSSFVFETADDPEFRAAWALTNLRPLWWRDNLAKRDKRLFLL
jgi:hypothetical protein